MMGVSHDVGGDTMTHDENIHYLTFVGIDTLLIR